VTDTPEPKTPLDQALDVFVYLPVGFVLDFPRSVPRYIDCGRRQLEVALRGLGVNPFGDDRKPAPAPATASSAATSAPGTSTVATPSTPAAGAGRLRSVPSGAPTPGPARPAGPTIDPAILAIPDYDSLSASQVVPRLDSLSVEELETVRQYEESKRRRKTILGKVAQLQAV
jgi:hypothetical protein